MIQEVVRSFVDDNVRERAQELDESEDFPLDLYREMARLGLFGITVPESLDGVGADCVAYSIVMEELARGYASVADQCGLLELVLSLLSIHGTTEQRRRYLTPILRFERTCAYAITESEAGSDVSGIRTTAVRSPAAGGSRRQDLDPQCAGVPTSRWCWRAPIRRPASAA